MKQVACNPCLCIIYASERFCVFGDKMLYLVTRIGNYKEMDMIVHYGQSQNSNSKLACDNRYYSVQSKVILQSIEDDKSFHTPLVYMNCTTEPAHISKVTTIPHRVKR